MPYTTSNGARIYWEERGQGEPVLFIMGIGFSLDMWERTVQWLEPHYRCILFDNRGAGRSDAPWRPYSIRQMARDAAAVMDAAGVSSAHVLGASMGGMIAQELVLNEPERVRSLVLGCTNMGWLWSALPRWRVFRGAAKALGKPPREAMRIIDTYLYHPDTPAHLRDEDLEIRMRWLPSRIGYLNQLLAILTWWGTRWRLHRIRTPIIVIHGEDDPLIPVENARSLVQRIPGASLGIVPHCCHVMPADAPERTRELILGFLREQPVTEHQSNRDHSQSNPDHP